MKVKDLLRETRAIGEWIDETGIKRPSLIAVDVTEDRYPADYSDLEVLRTKWMASFADYRDRNRFRISGYKFVWRDFKILGAYYCIFLGYVKI